MERIDIKKQIILPYKKRKKILDIKKLEKYKIKKKHLIFIIVLISTFVLYKRYLLFFLLTFLSSIFSFYHSKYNRTPMDFKFALFLGLFITRYYGIVFTFIFFVISDVIPALLGGESIDAPSLIFITWYFIVNSMVYLFPSISIVNLGPFLVIVEAIGSLFINRSFGIPSIVSFMVSILTIIVRIIYFLTIGTLLEPLLLSIS